MSGDEAKKEFDSTARIDPLYGHDAVVLTYTLNGEPGMIIVDREQFERQTAEARARPPATMGGPRTPERP